MAIQPMARTTSAISAALIIISLVATALAVTHTYVVQNQNISKVSDITDLGKVSSSQPLELTKTKTTANATAYTLVEITAKDAVSETALSGLEASGILLEIGRDEVITEFDRGILTTRRVHTDLAPLPKDFTKDYSIKIST